MATQIWVDGVLTTTDPGDGTYLQNVITSAAATNGATLIELEAGTTITRTSSTLTLPARASATDYVTIQTRNIDTIVSPYRRPTRASALAVVATTSTVANGSAVFTAGANANYYRLRGLRVFNNTPVSVTGSHYINYPVIYIGSGLTSASQISDRIEFDRLLIDHDDVAIALDYGAIVLTANNASCHHCYISGIRSTHDSDYYSIWVPAGRNVEIHDNYLESGGECVFLGAYGYFSSADTVQPDGISIRRNIITRNPDWQTEPIGAPYYCKNLLEIKNAKNVLIDGNYFYRAWQDEQTPAIVLSLRTETAGDGSSVSYPHAELKNIRVTNNIIRGFTMAVDINGYDQSGYDATVGYNGSTTGGGVLPAQDIAIHNNLMIEGDPATYGAGAGLPLRVQSGGRRISFRNNTVKHTHTYGGVAISTGTPTENLYVREFVFTSNIISNGVVCWQNASYNHGNVITNLMAENPVIQANVFAEDASSGSHGDYNEPVNEYTDSTATVDAAFTSTSIGDFRLVAGSAYEGKGCDIDRIRDSMYDPLGNTCIFPFTYTPKGKGGASCAW